MTSIGEGLKARFAKIVQFDVGRVHAAIDEELGDGICEVDLVDGTLRIFSEGFRYHGQRGDRAWRGASVTDVKLYTLVEIMAFQRRSDPRAVAEVVVVDDTGEFALRMHYEKYTSLSTALAELVQRCHRQAASGAG